MAAGVPTDLIAKILLSPELDFTDKTLGKEREATVLERVKRLVRDDRVELMKDLENICARPIAPGAISGRGIEVLLIADDEHAPVNPDYDYTFSIFGDYRRAHSNGNLMAKIANARAALLTKFPRLEDPVDPLLIKSSLQTNLSYAWEQTDQQILEKRIGLFQRHLAKFREEHNPSHVRLARKFFFTDQLLHLSLKLLDPEIKNLDQMNTALRKVLETIQWMDGASPIMSIVISWLVEVCVGDSSNLDKLFEYSDEAIQKYGSEWVQDAPIVRTLGGWKKIIKIIFERPSDRLNFIKAYIECMALVLKDIKDTTGIELSTLERKIGFGALPGTKAPARPTTPSPSTREEEHSMPASPAPSPSPAVPAAARTVSHRLSIPQSKGREEKA